MRFGKVFFITCAFTGIQLLSAEAEPLSGRVSQTEFQGIGTTQDLPAAPQGSHPLPSWFGVVDMSAQQQVSLTKMEPVTQQAPVVELKSQQATNDSLKASVVDHPDWIPLHAYTNDQMIGVYNFFVTLYGIPVLPLPGKISSHGQIMRMYKSITRYWRGGHYGNIQIYCGPIPGHPGNFIFGTIGDANGPRGWLQDMKQSRKGGRLYRYWFDEQLQIPQL